MDTLQQVKELKSSLGKIYDEIVKLQDCADDYIEKISEIQLNCEHDYELIELDEFIAHKCKLCDGTKYKYKI